MKLRPSTFAAPSLIALLCGASLLAGVAGLSGCTVEGGGESAAAPESEDQEVVGEALKKVTVVRGKVRPGETLSVPYEPKDPAYRDIIATKTRPYLAIEIDDSPVDAPSSPPAATPYTALQPQNGRLALGGRSVTVKGDFPGQPQVLVVDDTFRVVDATTATSTDGLQEAIVTVHPGKRFVLVRDKLWVKPMTFDVTVGR